MAGGQPPPPPPNPLPPLPNHVHIFHLCHITLPPIIQISLIWISPDPLIRLFAGQDHWSVAPPYHGRSCARMYSSFFFSPWYFLLLPPPPPLPLLTSNTNTFPQSVLHGIPELSLLELDNTILPILYQGIPLLLTPPSIAQQHQHFPSESPQWYPRVITVSVNCLPLCQESPTLSPRVSSMVPLSYHCWCFVPLALFNSYPNPTLLLSPFQPNHYPNLT